MMIGILIGVTSNITFGQCVNGRCYRQQPKIIYEQSSFVPTSTLYKQPSFVSTPNLVVEAMLMYAYPTELDLLYDAGCGDGRIIKTATQKYGCRSLGIEINPETAEIAKNNISNVPGVDVFVADATKVNYNKATIVTFYLDQETVNQIVPKLGDNVTRIISYMHPIPRKGVKKVFVNGEHVIYVWDKYTGGF